MRRWTMLVAVALIAGCADSQPTPQTTTAALPGEDLGGSGAPPEPRDTANYTAQHFDGGASLRVSEVTVGGGGLYLNNQNCAYLPPDFSELSNLTVTATWTSDLPTELVLFVSGEATRSVGPGPSPLRLTLDAMPGGETYIGVRADGVALEQDVMVDVSFDYVGLERLALEGGHYC